MRVYLRPKKKRIYLDSPEGRKLVDTGLVRKEPTGLRGFTRNLGRDFSSFAKGTLGIGREFIRHPIYNVSQVGKILSSTTRQLPSAVRHLPENIKFARRLTKGNYEQIKRNVRRHYLPQTAPRTQRNINRIGMGLFEHYANLFKHPLQTAYKEPFSVILDVLPFARGAGAIGARTLGKTKYGAKIAETAGDMFIPYHRLKRLGYGKVAEDVQKTQSAIRKAQEGIIKSTIKTFEKKFKLSKAEKLDFFETIDKLRRTPNVYPKSSNPKVQRAIDWWMKEELPKLQKGAGYNKTRLVKNKFKYINDEASAKKRLSEIIDEEADLMKSLQEEMGGVGTHMKGEASYGGDMGILRHSTNPQWYRDFYAKYKRAPSQAAIKEIAEENLKTGKGMLSDEYLRLTKLLKDLKLARKNKANFQDILETYNKAPIQNYLHHFFSPTKETRFGGKLSAPQRGFLKQSKDVEGFVKDPIVSIAGIKSKVATANIKDAFLKRIEKYAKPKNTVTEFKNGVILEKETGLPLIKYKGKYIPKDLGEELMRFEGKTPQAIDTLLKPLRAFNRNWKPLATAVRPRYHLRNILGNVYNASFIGGAGVMRYPEAIFQQMKGHITTQMREGTIAGKIYKALFKTPPEHKYIKMATQDDVVGRGFFSADINDLADIAETAKDFTKVIEKTKNPALIYRIPGLRQWMNSMQRLGSAFEDNARLALYIDQLKKGASRAAAKKYVNKHLFDYINGLGEGDKYIKAVIPFWSWTRFNIPLQVGAISKMPLRHLAVQRGATPWVQQQEAENPEYPYLSERQKSMGAVKIGEVRKNGKVYDKYMRTQSVLPIQDVARIPRIISGDPDELGITPLFDIMAQARYRFSPPTNPEENLNYFGRPVEQYPGEFRRFMGMPVRGTTREILGNIPLLTELNKLFGGSYTPEKRPDWKTRAETVISPTSTFLQDREKNREYFKRDFERIVKGRYSSGYESAFKGVIKKIMEAEQPDAVLEKNKEILKGLLKGMGYTDQRMQELALKAIEAELKKAYPKPLKPYQMRPHRPRPLLDPYYQRETYNQFNQLGL